MNRSEQGSADYDRLVEKIGGNTGAGGAILESLDYSAALAILSPAKGVETMGMKARDIMHRRVSVARPDAVARDLVLKLLSGTFSGLPVVDKKGAVIGVVTEFDLIKAKQQGKDLETVKAQEIMSRPPITVRESTPIEEIIATMTKHQIIRVPVVRKGGNLVGIITRSDLLSRMVAPESIFFLDG